MSEIDAILEGLDSHTMQSLETPAINSTSRSFSGANLAGATRKVMVHDQSNNMHYKTKGDFLMLYGTNCAYVDLRGSAMWYV